MRIWKALWRFEYGLAALGAGSCLMLVMLLTMASVFGRYVLHMDLIPGAYNIVERVLFPLLVFWALPLAHRDGMFPKLTPVTDPLLGPRGRAAVALFVGLVEIAVYAVVFWFVLRFVTRGVSGGRTFQIGADVWPMWPVIVMMPLAFGLMLVEMLRLVWRDVSVLAGWREPEAPPPDDEVYAGPL